MPVRVGTRGSRLALAQTEYVIALLTRHNSSLRFEIVPIETSGDKDRSSPLERIGGIGVFTKKIEQSLLDRVVDIAVHSAKDLPARMTEGLAIAAVPPREAAEDVWIAKEGQPLHELRPASVVGTGSPRRRAQLLYMRKDLRVADIRGNVPTRLKKLREGEYDALIMAHAGLKRLGLTANITHLLPPEVFVPAPGQGFLAVEIRADDRTTADITSPIDDPLAHRCLDIERLLLRKLGSGCSMAVGGRAFWEGDEISLHAVVLDLFGEKRIDASHKISARDEDEALVDHIVQILFAAGAKNLIRPL